MERNYGRVPTMNAFCPKCQKPVDGVFYSVSDDEFFSSIDTDAEVYVAHTHPDEGEGDHRWKLTDSDKRIYAAKGLRRAARLERHRQAVAR